MHKHHELDASAEVLFDFHNGDFSVSLLARGKSFFFFGFAVVSYARSKKLVNPT